ncbi:MAG: pre-peptidase C-terminal domain-containing protein, partial [Dolichospermum sp.]|nr:pre-peptidase C-terminal domain-containing protein [Dolichospermum sp.]
MSEPFFNFQQGLMPTPPYNYLGLSDYQDPLYSNPSNSAQLPVPFIDTVVQAIDATKYILSGLSGNSQRDYIMGTAFGLYNQDSANPILTDWAQNNFTNTPHIELVFGQNFNGAFAKENNTIYLSQEFVAANQDNVGAVTGVLVEEVGHSLDSQINVQDAAGDEGDIFSRLLRGQSISPGELVLLKGENDSAVISINGKAVSVEKNDTLATAINLGSLPDVCFTQNGWVGGNVPNDFYKFQINRPTKLTLDLVNLQSDVDLKLLDSNGNMIYSSAKSGTANEQISAQIGSGTYYIHVKAFSGSSYNLGITTTQGRMNPGTDVNGDGKADIIGFGPDNVVHTSLSNGDGTFRNSIGSTPGFTKNYGWTNFNDFPRMLADVNGDGKADIIGFGPDNVVHTSLSNG